jgi:hypothetical protein
MTTVVGISNASGELGEPKRDGPPVTVLHPIMNTKSTCNMIDGIASGTCRSSPPINTPLLPPDPGSW